MRSVYINIYGVLFQQQQAEYKDLKEPHKVLFLINISNIDFLAYRYIHNMYKLLVMRSKVRWSAT